MKYARAWLYHHYSRLVTGNRLVWEVNLGAPTGTWAAGSTALRDKYEKLGLTAWRLSQDRHITIIRAKELWADTSPTTAGWGLDALAVLPEFAAQVACYVRSPQRKDGLHLLVDVGAGTLDVACFRVMRDRTTTGDRFPVFASKVEQLGTHFLMRARASQADSANTWWKSTQRVPTKKEYSEKAGVDLNVVSKADEAFAKMVSDIVAAVIFHTRFVMDRTAPEFAAAGYMPVFITGGGASVESYWTGIDRAFRRLRLQNRLRSIPVDSIPTARFSIDKEVCSRLSVAYGLTYDAELIGQLIPSSEIPPLPPLAVRDRLDRDEIYPK
jgi:hypothetical protein